MKFTKPISLLCASFVIGSALQAEPDFSPTVEAERPNIILIMADDQGWGDTGYNGHPFLQTPVMDEMAREGFTFDRFYAAAPICSPTRASIMTGRHPIRSKVTSHGRYIRSHREQTLPRLLQENGYTTGMFGKWHLSSAQAESPVNPGGMGFDEWLIGLNFFDNSPYLSRNGIVEHRDGEVGSVIVIDETINFFKKHKDSGQPLFAVSWFPSPHDPHQELSSDPELYKGEQHYGYFQEITLMDEQIGRLRTWLREEGIADNTLIWYCSDNGGLLEASSGGRAKKGDTYEGGLRVPGIIEWPARGLKGTSNVPVVTSDMFPTIAALTGIKLDTDRPLDGIDIAPIIEGKTDSRSAIGFWHHFQGGQPTWSDRILKEVMEHQQGGAAGPAIPARLKKDIDAYPQFGDDALERGWVALLDWPLKLHRRGNTYSLYDLAQDPMETSDLLEKNQYANDVENMKQAMEQWQRSVLNSLNGNDYSEK